MLVGIVGLEADVADDAARLFVGGLAEQFLVALLPHLRPVAALVTAVFGGLAVGQHERHLPAEAATPSAESEGEARPTTWQGKLVETLRYGFFEMMQTMGRWLILGLIVAALITVLVPDDFFQTYARWPLLNMVVIVLVAVPMYICATGSIPIAAALMMKGLSPGCALVMLMAGPAANMASMLVISKSFGRKAMWAYLASIVLGAIAFGVVVDYWPGLRETFVSAMPHHHGAMSHQMPITWLNWVCSIFLIAMLVVGMGSNYWKSYKIKHNKTTAMKEFKVRGMMCNHCKATVEKGLAQLEGAEKVTVDLAQGIAYVEGNVDDAAVRAKVIELGFENG